MYGIQHHKPYPWFVTINFLPMLRVKLNCCLEVPVTQEVEALKPIIYSHGWSANRTQQSGTCRDFASQGFIVFSIDFRDGTCSDWIDDEGIQRSFYHEDIY